MEMNLTHANISLEPWREMSLTDAAGVEVTCHTGRVWLTMEGDSRDIIVAPGEAYAIERNGLTLVNAIEPSVLHLQPPRAQPAAWKQWLRKAWDALVSVGEARARARMKRGIYHF